MDKKVLACMVSKRINLPVLKGLAIHICVLTKGLYYEKKSPFYVAFPLQPYRRTFMALIARHLIKKNLAPPKRVITTTTTLTTTTILVEVI